MMPVNNVVIVGGGTSGWMQHLKIAIAKTAAALPRHENYLKRHCAAYNREGTI
ncbi:tryptophan 7-halogenase [Cellvibrio mixtus]|uniref:tryptophan 7-halogenase n=1 Tax=Cellvibrio mixtus TaxID=39650 RepID=UPI00114055A2|nr:tryptophan 7-halogenase [Cellvibrio mixtus]